MMANKIIDYVTRKLQAEVNVEMRLYIFTSFLIINKHFWIYEIP